MGKKQPKDPLGHRMKSFEAVSNFTLIPGTPKIIRLDGKAFHTFLKDAEKPFDKQVMESMCYAAEQVMSEIGGSARFAYIQSDECSIVLNDKMKINSEPWFANKIQKMVSVAASIMSVSFSQKLHGLRGDEFKPAFFDARVFELPNETEMYNAVLWRQFDAAKNSITMYASQYFSHKELHGKSGSNKQEMMWQKHRFNWNDAATWTKRGVVVRRTEEWTIIDRLQESPERRVFPILVDNATQDDIENTLFRLKQKYNEKGVSFTDNDFDVIKRSPLSIDWHIPMFNQDPDYIYNLYRN